MKLSSNIILILMILIALPCRSMEKEEQKDTIKNQLENFAELYILGSSSRETSADVPTSLSSEKIDIGLIDAVGRRDLTSVQLYLENKANPNSYVISIDKDGNIGQANFPLHMAVAAGFTEIADLLLKHGADVSIQSSRNMQALHLAAMSGHADMIQLLIDHGAEIDAMAEAGTPIHFAAAGGRADALEALVHNGADVNVLTNAGSTPLHVAIVEDRCKENVKVAMVTCLLEHGADINLQDKEGRQPINLALRKGLANVVGALVFNNADIYVLDAYEAPLLHYAVEAKASENIRIKMISCLLDNGANIHAADKHGQQTIHYAARGTSEKIIELLIKYGADLTATTNSGHRPIDFAQESKQYALARFIRQKIASNKQPIRSNTNTQTKNPSTSSKSKEAEKKIESGEKEEPIKHKSLAASSDKHKENTETAKPSSRPQKAEKGDSTILTRPRGKNIYEAIKNNDRESVKLFLSQGVKINAVVTSDESTRGEYTCIDAAAISGNVEIGRLLVSYGANVNGRSENNAFTPIHYAAIHGHVNFIEWLISEGVDVCPPKPVNMRLIGVGNIWSATGMQYTNEGVQPIHLAAFEGKLEVVKLLVQKGVDIATRDKAGNQPIHWSMMNCHTALADWLISNGAKVDAKNKKGKTVVDIAKWSAKRYKDQTISEWISKHDSWFNKLMHF